MCFLSPLVEVGGFAFLAAELDDVAEGAIGGVADQPKTTATVGAPLHAVLPSLQFFNPPERREEGSAPALFASKLALTCDSLVSFGGALDPILNLAVTLRQLLGYYVAAANCTAVSADVRCQRDCLTLAKFMVCH
jgi:hypothetical protein